jgi:hypothetical protein
MLLTLAVSSLRKLTKSNGQGRLSAFDLPDFAITTLQLRGLNIPASMLAGWSLPDLDKFRDRADKAGCPCLVLVEDVPLRCADEDPAKRKAAGERISRLGVAANRLGANAVAIRCEADDDSESFDATVATVKSVMRPIERLELNLLIGPTKGLTETPERLTELIKRIGGFRIGALPDFGHAASSGDVAATLRKLAPYAGAIHATVQGFTKSGAHKGYDLADCVNAIRSVGFLNTLAIEYTGNADPVSEIEKARKILQTAIDAGQE